jgi:hypothetical protein
MGTSTTTDTYQLPQNIVPDIVPDIQVVPDIPELPQKILESRIESIATSVTFQKRPTRSFNYRRLGAGIIVDIRARAPWYLSDWTDAWNYRVVPATALIFFAK